MDFGEPGGTKVVMAERRCKNSPVGDIVPAGACIASISEYVRHNRRAGIHPSRRERIPAINRAIAGPVATPLLLAKERSYFAVRSVLFSPG
jgi:hypothetical protein